MFVPFDMRSVVIDFIDVKNVFELLAIQKFEDAEGLNQITTSFLDRLTARLFLIQLVNILKLTQQKGHTLHMKVGLAL